MYWGLTITDWLVVATTMFVVAAVGLLAGRRTRDINDYLVGGRRFRAGLLTCFNFAAGTSAGKPASVAGVAFRIGWAGIWYQFVWLLLLPFEWVIPALFRRLRVLTVGDFFERRFGPGIAGLYALYGIMLCLAGLAGELWITGKLADVLTGGQFPARYAVAGMAGILLLYTLVGGLRAGIAVSVIHTVLTAVLAVLLLPFVFEHIGGLEGLRSACHAVAGERPGLLDLTLTADQATHITKPFLRPFYVAMLAIIVLAGMVVQPGIACGTGAGRTELDVRIASVAGGAIKRVCSVTWTLIGLACIAMYLTPQRLAAFAAHPPYKLEKEFADQVFCMAAGDLLPAASAGLLGLLLAGLLCAAMSTCHLQTVAAGGLLSRNLLQPLLGPRRGLPSLALARIASFIVLLAAAVLAFRLTSVWNLIEILIGVPAVLGVSFWLGIFWRRYSSAAVIASSGVGFAAWVFMEYQGSVRLIQRFFPSVVTVIKGKLEVDDAWIMLVYMSITAMTGIVVSLLTRPVPQSVLDSFFRILHTRVRPDEPATETPALPLEPSARAVHKLIDHPDLEIVRPSAISIVGFILAILVAAGMVMMVVRLAAWTARAS